MTKQFVPKIISANDLLNGHVIYLAENGWVTDPSHATVAQSLSEGAELLVRAESDPHIAVGPYLVDVNTGEGSTPQPMAIRERMRISGPSIANGQHSNENWLGL